MASRLAGSNRSRFLPVRPYDVAERSALGAADRPAGDHCDRWPPGVAIDAETVVAHDPARAGAIACGAAVQLLDEDQIARAHVPEEREMGVAMGGEDRGAACS